MILVDANLLIYAHNEQAQQHAAARAWLEEVLAGSEPIALPWSVVLAFLRIVTDGRIIRPPLGMAEAVAITTGWFEDFGVFCADAGRTALADSARPDCCRPVFGRAAERRASGRDGHRARRDAVHG